MILTFLFAFVIGWVVRGMSAGPRAEHRPRLTPGVWVDDCCRNGHLRAPALLIAKRSAGRWKPFERPAPTSIPGPGDRSPQ